MSTAERLEETRSRIADAAEAAERDPQDVTLIAVSKTFGPDAITPVIDAGQRVFGENRVQEAQGKWPNLKKAHPDLSLHLIGPLQSNKAKDAIALFDVIETIDRPKIAAAIAREMERSGARPELYVQVNTGDEPQKAGISPTDAADFVRECRDVHGLAIAGLMCIPPFDEEPAMHFALLEKLAEECEVEKLSMGMSGDFEKAIRYGATHIRVGTAIFGRRDPVPG